MKKSLAVLLVLVLLRTIASAAGAEGVRTLTVNGTATVMKEADSARVALAVFTQAAEASEASRQNAEAVRTLTAALENAGIPKKDVTTGGYWVNPLRDYESSEERIIGYQINHQLTVIVRDQNRVGEIVDLALENGATGCDYFSFATTQAGAAQDEALVAAVGEARRRAELLAQACGGTLGGIISVEEPSYTQSGIVVETANKDEAASAGTEILAEGLSFTATVTVTFELK